MNSFIQKEKFLIITERIILLEISVLPINKLIAEKKKKVECNHQFFGLYPDILLAFPFLRVSVVTYQPLSKARLFCSFYVLTMGTDVRFPSQNLAIHINAMSLLLTKQNCSALICKKHEKLTCCIWNATHFPAITTLNSFSRTQKARAS